jgi:predicted phage terminase large subunit-like protein
VADIRSVANDIRKLSFRQTVEFWDYLTRDAKARGELQQIVRILCQADLYYLLVRVCRREDLLPCVNRPGFIDNQFMFERCREVEANPDGFLDLWSREHGKSSIVTFGLTIQNILNNPELTFGIFSHTRPIAKAFLRQIMREFEENTALHATFPDILWGRDIKSSPKWSEDDGIIVKRKGNPNEATVEAWGLVDGQPVSRHFQVLVYDDIVVQASVTTPEMISKTMQRLEESYNLGTTGGVKRMAGTRWHFADAYRTVIDRGTFKLREHPGRIGGTEEGETVFWSDETHRAKRAEQGPHTYASQILLNPKADSLQGFQREWLRHYRSITPGHAAKMNKYILVDAASSKKKGSDFSAFWVIGLGIDGNYYALDMVRDRLSLTERAERLFELHRKWKPRQVRYERYGLQSDIDHFRSKMETDSYRFDITEVAGQTKKADRIGRLIPIFEQGKFWLPKSLHATDYQKNAIDLVRAFVEEEYVAFPVGVHDDMLDSLSRIAEPDLKLVWPKEQKIADLPPPRRSPENRNAWMA